MASNETISLIVKTVKERNLSYDTLAEKTQISKTTIYRLMAKNVASSYTLERVIDFLEINDQVREIEGKEIETVRPACEFASELYTELQEIREFYEEKAVSVREHYESQLSFLRGQIEKMEESNRAEREAAKENYERNITHLQTNISNQEKEFERLHGWLDKKDIIILVKDRVIIGMLVALIIVLIICCAALMTDSIV